MKVNVEYYSDEIIVVITSKKQCETYFITNHSILSQTRIRRSRNSFKWLGIVFCLNTESDKPLLKKKQS